MRSTDGRELAVVGDRTPISRLLVPAVLIAIVAAAGCGNVTLPVSDGGANGGAGGKGGSGGGSGGAGGGGSGGAGGGGARGGRGHGRRERGGRRGRRVARRRHRRAPRVLYARRGGVQGPQRLPGHLLS